MTAQRTCDKGKGDSTKERRLGGCVSVRLLWLAGTCVAATSKRGALAICSRVAVREGGLC